MKTLLAILLISAAISAKCAEKLSVMVLTNGAIYYPTNLWLANSNEINAVIRHPEIGMLDGFKMSPAVSSVSTNYYWWDFGQTNAMGQKLIYATLNATNTVNFLGPTNGQPWSLLSIGVYANGGDRSILIPSNLPFLSTNGMTLSNGMYVLNLPSGSLLRFTIQSNEFGLESQWTVKP